MSAGAFSLPKPTYDSYEPLNDCVMVRMVLQGENTGGKIIRPDVAQMESFYGRVVKIGPGRPVYVETDDGIRVERIPISVRVGQDVLFHRFHGERVDFDGDLYCTLKEADLLGSLDLSRAIAEKYCRWASRADEEFIGQLDLHRTAG